MDYLNDEKQKGALITYKIENYGIANEFYEPDGTITDFKLSERQKQSGMPKEYVYKSGNDFKWNYYNDNTDEQKKFVNAFVYNFERFKKEGRGLYIYSHTKGTGKTMLSCCIANEILKKEDISVKFINVTDYIELIKDKSEISKEQVQRIHDAGLLILDDVGVQVEDKAWITTALFRLIDSRCTGLRPTIFTSNVKLEDLKTDGRISERIYALSFPVIMPEENIRRKIADKHKVAFLESFMELKTKQ